MRGVLNCQYCQGTGIVTVDYNDQSDYYGHGQDENPCECELKALDM